MRFLSSSLYSTLEESIILMNVLNARFGLVQQMQGYAHDENVYQHLVDEMLEDYQSLYIRLCMVYDGMKPLRELDEFVSQG